MTAYCANCSRKFKLGRHHMTLHIIQFDHETVRCHYGDTEVRSWAILTNKPMTAPVRNTRNCIL